MSPQRMRAGGIHSITKPCVGLFPLTPSLSLGERANHALRAEQSRRLGSPLRDARCFLSLRERIKVRGNSANCHLAYRPFPDLSNLDGRNQWFPKMTMKTVALKSDALCLVLGVYLVLGFWCLEF